MDSSVVYHFKPSWRPSNSTSVLVVTSGLWFTTAVGEVHVSATHTPHHGNMVLMAARPRASAAHRRHPKVPVDHPPARVG